MKKKLICIMLYAVLLVIIGCGEEARPFQEGPVCKTESDECISPPNFQSHGWQCGGQNGVPAVQNDNGCCDDLQVTMTWSPGVQQGETIPYVQADFFDEGVLVASRGYSPSHGAQPGPAWPGVSGAAVPMTVTVVANQEAWTIRKIPCGGHLRLSYYSGFDPMNGSDLIFRLSRQINIQCSNDLCDGTGTAPGGGTYDPPEEAPGSFPLPPDTWKAFLEEQELFEYDGLTWEVIE